MSNIKEKLCAVVMAGGKGTRFWPLSTDKKPKQFLNLLGNDTMLQMTVKRLLGLISMDNIYVVTGEQYAEYVYSQLPDLQRENVIIEPVGRNTAPCIGLAAFYINERVKDATLVVLPADHLIENKELFLENIKRGAEFVEDNKESIITLGITPTRPETAYGYIKYNREDFCEYGLEEVAISCGANVCINKGANKNFIYKVDKFVEKPKIDCAKKYIEQGNYLWNAGIFIWKANNAINLINQYLPSTYELLADTFKDEANEMENQCYEDRLVNNYEKMECISIDFAVMEKAENMYVIPACFKWDDVGSWKALERYRNKDDNMNTLVGNVKKMKGNNNIVITGKKPVIICGLDDIIFVENDEGIFVGSKKSIESAQKERKI
ncbi:mannose-1-phosphate guanylyltransferase [Hathewaya proteolytica DSM 3090]|uniref:mannose-1-phosphate guanylyltransferase n=1 Tax=Hathewaya proteolytica DSM 3090 TaxID=1121331 RepID=A0A1M6PJ62_9CLOT|nr:mannose-1-phosphate guanylyltransferase [Hathewaya proteolytica]SHK07992.1 mannose-1-phosphate guanylyltransferase [Hathewaya proteolytica DSM 3090]